MDDAAGRIQIFQKLKDLSGTKVGDGVKVAGTVAPLGKIAHEYLTAVAGAGYKAVFRCGHSVEAGHTKSRCQIGQGLSVQRSGLTKARLQRPMGPAQVNSPPLDAEALRQKPAVVCILAVVAL